MASDHPVILHVDDDDDIREIALIAMTVVGNLNVIQCSSGAEAISRAPELRPDLFLLDVMMPDMSGVETLQKLRQIEGLEHVPGIFMTAKVQQKDIAALIAAGGDAVISKPFDPMTLAAEITQIWQAQGPRTRSAA